jgi:hypothetical protein
VFSLIHGYPHGGDYYPQQQCKHAASVARVSSTVRLLHAAPTHAAHTRITHALSLSLSLSDTHTHTHTHALSLSLSLSLSLTHTHTHTPTGRGEKREKDL